VNAEHRVGPWSPPLTDEMVYGFNDGILRAFPIAEQGVKRLKELGSWYVNARPDLPWAKDAGTELPLPAGAKLPDKWFPRRVDIKAGGRLYASGRDHVLALDEPTADRPPRVVWVAETPGMPTSLAVGDGKLFVATSEGKLFCYGGDKREATVHAWPAARPQAGDEATARLVTDILAAGIRTEGLAVVWGLKDGRLVEELIRRTSLRVVAFDGDAAKVASLRRRFEPVGLLGRRLRLVAAAPEKLSFEEDSADVLVSEDPASAGLSAGGESLAAAVRLLRYDGGAACVALDDSAHAAASAAVARLSTCRAEVVRRGAVTGILRREGPGYRLRQLAGARCRVVWLQDHSPDQNDSFAAGSHHKLMGFDSDDGKAERIILDKLDNYARPLLTPDGRQIIFTNRPQRKSYIVGWDGSGLRELVGGHVMDIAPDPNGGRPWVYYQHDSGGKSAVGKGNPVWRFRLDDPDRRELVWDKSAVSSDNFQVSADGLRACAQWPWPKAGVAELPAKGLVFSMEGCWTSLAPDNSYLFSVFEGTHRVVTMRPTADRARSWSVRLNTAPGTEAWEVYHPRWTNHVRFMAITGPYTVRAGPDALKGRGHTVEVFVGRFSPDMTRIEAWAQVTRNDRPDYYPDAWIDGGEKASVAAAFNPGAGAAMPTTGPADSWPGSRDGLVFLWADARAANQVRGPDGKLVRICRVEARGRARHGRYHEMLLSGGSMLADGVGPALLDACRKSGQLTIQFVATPPASRSGTVLWFGPADAPSVAVVQDGNDLSVRLGGNGKPMKLATLAPGKPRHVVISLAPDRLACYADGKLAAEGKGVAMPMSDWKAGELVFGDCPGGGANWPGRLEGVAVCARALDADEAGRHYAGYAPRLAGRKPVPRIVVDGRLVETTPTPTSAAIAPYRRCLVVYRYEVTKVAEGQFRDRHVHVAHWAIFDARPVALANEHGKTCRLVLERFADHPELSAERRLGGPEDSAALYFDPAD